MTTTTVISATTSANTYTFTLADGSSTAFAVDDLSPGEFVYVDRLDASGSYTLLTYTDPEGFNRDAKMTYSSGTIKINGPVDGRIRKPATNNAVAVVQYS